MKIAASLCLTVPLVAACSVEDSTPPPTMPSGDAAGTRPVGQPQTVVYEGQVGEGTECRTLTTDGGEVWSFSDPDGQTRAGERVRITGEIADASYCMEGKGTLIPFEIEQL